MPVSAGSGAAGGVRYRALGEGFLVERWVKLDGVRRRIA